MSGAGLIGIVLLLLCNTLVPLAFVIKQCASRRGLEINHIFLFSFGYLIYWISPIALGAAQLFGAEQGEGGIGLWYRLYDQIPQATVALYLGMTLAVYLAFCAGTVACQRWRPGIETRTQRFFFDRRLLNVYLGFGVFLAAVYALTLRGQFFKGYTAEEAFTTDYGTRGTFTAISVFLLSLAILYTFKRQERNPEMTFRAAISHRFFLAYFVVGFLVLSLGGRLYFLSALIMLLVYRSVHFRPISYRVFFSVLLVGLALLGVVGTLRMGVGVTSFGVLISLVSEPLFNSFSLLQYLNDGKFDLIRFPIFLMGDFVNLVPTVLLPGKAALILNPTDYGYTVFSPLGALNSFFSFMINFGFFGTAAVMALIGFFLQQLRSRSRNVLTKTIYVMVSGWLLTSFFRDPFSISLVKSIFQFSILLPALIAASASMVTVYFLGVPRRPEARRDGPISDSSE